MIRALPFLLMLALDIYCVITCLQARKDEIRFLPKIGWLALILLFPLVGDIAWLVLGRERGTGRGSRHERPVPQFPEYDRPGQAGGITPESDEEFLRRVRERAEEQRRRAAEQKKQREAQENPPADPTDTP